MMDDIKRLFGASQLKQANNMQNALWGMQSQPVNPYQQQAQLGAGGITNTSNEKLLVDSLADTNYAMKKLAERLEKQERRIDMLSGFYTWITEVHPEIAAQHKAMRDLYEAANSNETQGRQT
jgi:hypothetical protein